MGALLDRISLVRPGEWPKFILMSMMMMCILYVYSIVRASKDAVVISMMGAELLSTIKLWGVLPSAIIFMLCYTKLADVFERTELTHIMVWFFVAFFLLFGLFLFPHANSIHIDFSESIQSMPYLKYGLIMVGNWSYTLFYIMAELWGSAVVSLVFWQIANQVTSVDAAKRLYPMMGFMGQIGLFASGVLMKVFTTLTAESGGWQTSLVYISVSIAVSGVIISICFKKLVALVGRDLINGKASMDNKPKKARVKMGFKDSLVYVFSSKYICQIALLIICYGVSINLVEGVWKKCASILYTDPNDLASFMGDVQIYTSAFAFAAMILGGYLLSIMSWRLAAMFTPIVIGITGILFFLFVLYRDSITEYAGFLGMGALMIAGVLGAAQNILSKSTKYAFFDPTKEMAFIPLDEELKGKGKAAADIIGGRLGKSGGAVIQFMMLQFIIGSSLISIAPYIFVIFLAVMVLWFYAVSDLSKDFEIKKAEYDIINPAGVEARGNKAAAS